MLNGSHTDGVQPQQQMLHDIYELFRECGAQVWTFFFPHGFSRSKSNWQSKKGKTFIIGMLISPKARSVKNKRIDIVHKMY